MHIAIQSRLKTDMHKDLGLGLNSVQSVHDLLRKDQGVSGQRYKD